MPFLGNYIRNLVSVAAGRQPSRPLLFSYYVTHRCELNCAYCSDGDGKRFKEERIPELSTPQACRLISTLSREADTLDVTGGEPMLREDLGEILAHARGAGMRTVLNTKGIGLEDRPDLLDHVSVLALSVDSLDAGRLAEMIGRGAATAERILGALDFALARRPRPAAGPPRRAHRPQAGFRLVLSAVASPANLGDVSRVAAFATERGLGFHLSPQIVGTEVNPELRGNAAYEALVEEVLRLKRRRRGILGVPQYFRGIRRFSPFRCHPFLMPVVRPDGRLYYPCLESKRAEISLLEAGSFRSALRASRERFGDVPECGACCHIFCHMGLSLLQRHPLAAAGEWRHWRN